MAEQTLSVILNPGAGKKGGDPDQLRSLFQQHGITASILVASKGADLGKLALEAVRKDKIIVAGGGDGTVNGIASALASTDSLLGVLPLGTLNHFAKDLGLPLEISDAVRVIAQQYVSSVDVGEVNEQSLLITPAWEFIQASFLSGSVFNEPVSTNGWLCWWRLSKCYVACPGSRCGCRLTRKVWYEALTLFSWETMNMRSQEPSSEPGAV